MGVIDQTLSVAHAEPARQAPFALTFGFAVVLSATTFVAPPLFTWSGSPFRDERTVTGGITEGASSSAGVVAVVGLVESLGHTDSPVDVNSVAELREISGLTADQIGRMFGVSRRSVQNWIAGGTMASQHEERLSSLLSAIRPLGSTADLRRAALLRAANGISLFHRLVGEVQNDVLLHPTGLTVRNRLEA